MTKNNKYVALSNNSKQNNFILPKQANSSRLFKYFSPDIKSFAKVGRMEKGLVSKIEFGSARNGRFFDQKSAWKSGVGRGDVFLLKKKNRDPMLSISRAAFLEGEEAALVEQNEQGRKKTRKLLHDSVNDPSLRLPESSYRQMTDRNRHDPSLRLPQHEKTDRNRYVS